MHVINFKQTHSCKSQISNHLYEHEPQYAIYQKHIVMKLVSL